MECGDILLNYAKRDDITPREGVDVSRKLLRGVHATYTYIISCNGCLYYGQTDDSAIEYAE